jgi:DNA-directed RNA polymerase beta' subunit
MNTKLLFTFADLSVKDKAAKAAIKYFSRAGAHVVDQDVSTQVKRTSGISYREMKLTFADSQTVLFRIKQSGDIYQILLNGKLTPIKHQDDHVAAITELVQMLDTGRTKFQAKMAKALVKLPPSIKTAAPKMLQVMTEKRDVLKEAIAAVREEIAQLRGVATETT